MLCIDGREISRSYPPYLIAEIGANHGGDFELAKELIKAASDAGADAVKFQCYEPWEMTIDCDNDDFRIKEGLWKVRKLYELYQTAHTPRWWVPHLFETAHFIGITIFASVFSPDGVEFLESIGCPAYKIASFEIGYEELIEAATNTKKPVIISTGMASYPEVKRAVDLVHRYQENVGVLECSSGYPTPLEEAPISEALRDNWLSNATMGISDHTIGHEAAIAATAMGARIIEKHLRLPVSNTEDSAFSANPAEFKEMADKVRKIWHAINKNSTPSEAPQLPLRRSLYVIKDIEEGEVLTRENIACIRPGYGLPPAYLKDALGRTATVSMKRGDRLYLGMFI